ncbi:MAG: hypothetical protein FIA99_19810 [Ruminiclostridium sp.]|nr:hypothetical protein [Ruminiclostridium sp.]
MVNPIMDRRLILLKELLLEMKDSDSQMECLIIEIEKLSGVYYQYAYSECREEIQAEIDKYTNNNSRINNINHEITSKINFWFDFVKNTNEVSKLTFPFMFFLKKRKLRKLLKKSNDEISSITIDNRFIKEKLTLLEHQLEIKAIQKIKEDKAYLDYDRLLKKKDLLASELVYLLPTISGLCPAVIDSPGINELFKRLSKLEVA